MATVLLQELSNTDIDWMVTTGERQSIAAGTVLLQPCEASESIYLLLEGTFGAMVPAGNGDPTRHHPALEQVITRIDRGELVGETSLFNICSMPAVIQALEPSTVLSIPISKLVAKLEQDLNFSAHFYRAVALILSQRLQQILNHRDQLEMPADPLMKEALFVFSELRDSDIDWLATRGHVEKVLPDKVVIQAGRPIDAFYLILDGLLSVSAPEGEHDPLALCFQGLERKGRLQTAVANLSRGELVGATFFLDFQPLPYTIKAVRETLLLAVPRPLLLTKLQQDAGFASRFYRILTIQLTNSLQLVMNQVGANQRTYRQTQTLNDSVEYDDELCLTSLGQISQGATKFNWILKRLGIA